MNSGYNQYAMLFLFIIVLGVLSFLYSKYKSKHDKKSIFNLGGCKSEVFHLSENIYSYNEARQACAAHGASLATLEQLKTAHEHGANWCNYGWSENQMALYPVQKSYWDLIQANPETKGKCRNHGINGGYFFNDSIKFGANCYGVKPEKTVDISANNKFKCPEQEKKEEEKNLFIGKNLKIAPFNCSKWYK